MMSAIFNKIISFEGYACNYGYVWMDNTYSCEVVADPAHLIITITVRLLLPSLLFEQIPRIVNYIEQKTELSVAKETTCRGSAPCSGKAVFGYSVSVWRESELTFLLQNLI
jgi:hypothetical protein